MPGLDVPNFDILSPQAGKTPGLFLGLDPDYQAKQLAVQQSQNQLGIQQQLIGRLSAPDPFDEPSPAAAGAVQAASVPAARGGSSAAAGTGAGVDPLDVYAHSIGALESGNRYDALGQTQKSGDRAYGRFQVMGSNVGPWTKEVLGQAMTPDQFLASPQAQDAVFKAKFGQSVQQYNNPMDAASVWFSGKPIARAGNASDSLGTTVPAYLQKFAAGLGPAAQAVRGGQQPGAYPPVAPPNVTGQAAQPAPQAAPAPISFGGPASTPQQPVPQATAGGQPPVTDTQYQAALRIAAKAQDMDPRQMSPQDQQYATQATEIVSRYQQEQNTPAAGDGVQVAQNGTSDAPPSGQHPFGPGGAGGAPAGGQQPPQVMPQGAGGAGASPNGLSAPQQAGAPRPPVVQAGAGGPTSSPPPLTVPLRTAMQTAIAADPTMGGLLSGRFVGNPAAAINYLRKQQELYALGGVGPAADAFKARADNIEKTVERLDQMTPEQRNARDPAAVAYEQSRADYQNRSRLQADTDPSRVSFAGNEAAARAQAGLDVSSSPQAIRAKGQEAEAAAAGAEQGKNSAAAIGARAQNAAQVAEATQSGDALGKLPGQYAQAATAATKQNSIISDMLDQAGQFNMGANADREQGLNAVMSDLGHRMGVDVSSIDGKVAGYQQYVKLGGNLVRQAIKDTGGRAGGIQEMQFVSNTLPSPSTSPDGFKGIAAFLQGSNDYEVAKQQAADAYKAKTGSLAGFENSFVQNVSPTATILHRLQQDQPAMFQQTVARLKQSPAGQAVLKKAAQGLTYLSSTGVGG